MQLFFAGTAIVVVVARGYSGGSPLLPHYVHLNARILVAVADEVVLTSTSTCATNILDHGQIFIFLTIHFSIFDSRKHVYSRVREHF